MMIKYWYAWYFSLVVGHSLDLVLCMEPTIKDACRNVKLKYELLKRNKKSSAMLNWQKRRSDVLQVMELNYSVVAFEEINVFVFTKFYRGKRCNCCFVNTQAIYFRSSANALNLTELSDSLNLLCNKILKLRKSFTLFVLNFNF